MNLSAGIKELVNAKGLPEDVIYDTVKELLMQAYYDFKKAKEVRISQDPEKNTLDIFITKKIVKKVKDPVNEITQKEAEKILKVKDLSGVEQVDIPSDPAKDFKEKEILSVIEELMNKINSVEKDIIKYKYFKKKNKLVTGTIIKKDSEGNLFVDLGDTTAVLPVSEQSPNEIYEVDDMIKAVVKDVLSDPPSKKKTGRDIAFRNIRVSLSRNSPELVKELLALEVPDISDGTIQIKRIVREAGYKTKIAVYSDTVDPVSACIGPHGLRITNVIKEIGGEKIDIIRYSENPKEFIKAALTPAKVDRVIIQDENSKIAFAIVTDKVQLGYAYGKQRKNTILAARLCGWKINVKTEAEANSENIESEGLKSLKSIFNDEGTPLKELPELSASIIAILENAGIHTIEKLVEVNEKENYSTITGLKEEDIAEIRRILNEFVEVENEETEVSTEDEIHCPYCDFGFKLSDIDLKKPACPSCQKTLEIEFEE